MTKLLAILTMSVLPATAIGATDPHSYAEPDKFLVRHVDLDLRADFEAHRLEGTAELTVEQVDPGADTLSLDTRALEIKSVHLIEMSGRAKVLAFKLGEPDPILGSRLTVEFPHCCAATSQMRIRIAYRTSNTASALQWLEPAQTSGTHPYMYSQGQAIHTRSWIPIQDSPGIRLTYGARIVAPPELVAVMSAARVADADDPRGEFRFEMKQPIPAYLIALAIGDLEFQSLGARVGVWTEPVSARRRGERAGRPAAHAGSGRGHGGTLPLGPLRRAHHAARFRLRRHGEPAAVVRLAVHHRG